MSVFVIAEAGVNHNGDINVAKRMIDEAAAAGADAVKFQSFQAEKLVCRDAGKADYQIKRTGEHESQFQMLKKLELSEEGQKELFDYCRKKKILFLSSPFDCESAVMLKRLGMTIFKVPSGEITNLPYLRTVAGLGDKVILSTGMCTMKEVEDALGVLQRGGTSDISILHCNTEYPTPMKDVNLNVMLSLKEKFGLPVGYSDHTEGIEVPIAAVALGASVIEKHFTLDRGMEGPDHKASLEPKELRQMIYSIRNIELALGGWEKKPTESEIKNRDVARKSIVALRKISKGETFTEANITVKRPGMGISPMRWDEVIGRVAVRDYCADEMIEL